MTHTETHKRVRSIIEEAAGELVKENAEVKEADGLFRSSKEYDSLARVDDICITSDGSYPEPEVRQVEAMGGDAAFSLLYSNSNDSKPHIGASKDFGSNSLKKFADLLMSEGYESIHEELQTAISEYQEMVREETTIEQVVDAFDEYDRGFLKNVFSESYQGDDEIQSLINDREYNTDLHRHYVGERYAVVSFRNGTLEHGAFVIGQDNTPEGFFVHEVDDTNIDTREGETEVGIDGIRRLLGFDEEYEATPGTFDFAPQTRYRVQGDLRMTPLKVGMESQEVIREVSAASAFHESLRHVFGGRELERLLSDIRAYFYNDEVIAKIYRTYRAGAANLFYGQFPEPSDTGEVNVSREISGELTELYSKYVDGEQVSSSGWEWGNETLPIDNHLVRISEGELYPLSNRQSEPVIVAVPSGATVSILHDEHPEVRFNLEGGVYEFSLLPRGDVPNGYAAPHP